MAAYTVPTIAITGSPKDYTGLVAARRRQKEADEAKAKEARRKKDEEIYKATTVKNTEYLPMRIPQVLQKKAEIVNRMLEASQSGDFSANDAAKTEYEAFLQNLKNEKIDADKAIMGTEKGSHLASGNLRKLYSASSPEEIKDLVDSGDVVIEEGTGRIVPNLIPNTDFTQVWKGLSSNYKNKHTGELKTAEDGTQFFELSYDLPGLQAGLNATYVNDPNIRKKAELVYRQNNDTTGMSPETIAQKAKEDFIANGLEFGSEGQWQRKPGKAGLTINNNNYIGGKGNKATPYGDFPEAEKMVTFNPITGEKETYASQNFYGYSFGNVKVATSVPVGATYLDSGEPVNDADVRDAVFNQFRGKVVFNRDWKDPVTRKVYPKGGLIPKEFQDAAIDGGYAKAKTVAVGLANGQSIIFDDSGINPSSYAAASQGEKAEVVRQLEAAKADEKALQARINRRYLQAKKEGKDFSKYSPTPAEKKNVIVEPKVETKESTSSERATPIVPNANRQAEIDEEKRKKAAKIAKDAGIAPIPR